MCTLLSGLLSPDSTLELTLPLQSCQSPSWSHFWYLHLLCSLPLRPSQSSSLSLVSHRPCDIILHCWFRCCKLATSRRQATQPVRRSASALLPLGRRCPVPLCSAILLRSLSVLPFCCSATKLCHQCRPVAVLVPQSPGLSHGSS